MFSRRDWVIAILLFAGQALAAERVIQVTGLFKNAAVIRVNGKQVLLKKGQPGPVGLILVEANSKYAVLRRGGKTKRYELGRKIGGSYKPRVAAEVVVRSNDFGQYLTTGSINGFPVTFLVDTGANKVALNENLAKRLGIDYRHQGKEGQAMTAAGVTRAWSLSLNQVKVGEIAANNIAAVVVEGSSPHYVLLGMSFLDLVSFAEKDSRIHLQKKY